MTDVTGRTGSIALPSAASSPSTRVPRRGSWRRLVSTAVATILLFGSATPAFADDEPAGGKDKAATAAEAKATPDCVDKLPEPKPVPEPPTGGRFAGVYLTDDQVQTAATVIAAGKGLKATPRGTRIALAVALQSSSLNPWAENQGQYYGLFQQLVDPVTGLYSDHDRLDPLGASRMFYEQLQLRVPKYDKDKRKDWELGEVVQETGTGPLFDQWAPAADALMKKLYKSTAAHDFDPPPPPVLCAKEASGASGVPSVFDPGYIISDEVFYNSNAMTVDEVREFIGGQGADCSGDWCLANLKVTTEDQPADEFCDAYTGAEEDAASVITKVATACHVNPQVMLVTLQKESGLLSAGHADESDYHAAWGWHCPDTGPGGSANCDPAYAGFFRQAYGMAKQWSRYVVNPDKYHYQAGETEHILWNVEQSGCGGADVHIRNKATASLYNYTPYQPNEAALESYPGTGDSCSAYGNRNFFRLYGKYFGTSGTVDISVTGVDVVIPENAHVPDELVGATIKAPTAEMARGIAAGLSNLGLPYVWGGGTAGGAADDGCVRGGGSKNSCQGIIGFDCSGLTGFVLNEAGFDIPDNSSGQRGAGTDVAWADALPGDIIGWDGHVAIYLGTIDGEQYLLQAPQPGESVEIRTVYGGHDSVVHRYWG